MPRPGPGGFTVDPASLREMARSFILLAASLDIARVEARSVEASAFGSDRLAQATTAFVDHWEWQAKKVGDHLMDASGRLREAAENYQNVEDAQKRAEGLM